MKTDWNKLIEESEQLEKIFDRAISIVERQIEKSLKISHNE